MPKMVTRLFGHKDVPEALKLSDSVGWNEISEDWHRFLDLEPNGCLGAWSSSHAADLLAAAADLLDGNEIIVISVESFDYGRMLQRVGVVLRRRLTRMTHDRISYILTNEHTASATCFAWGWRAGMHVSSKKVARRLAAIAPPLSRAQSSVSG